MSQKWESKTQCLLPTVHGVLNLRVYKPVNPYEPEPVVIFKGEIENESNVLMRIHSECITSEVFGSKKCDCNEQLEYAIAKIAEEGGLVIYLRQEGRGIGLFNKIRAYALQDQNYDTIQANVALGLPVDAREYDWVLDILEDFKVDSIRLMTNNPEKLAFIEEHGILVERVPVETGLCEHNYKYLRTKKDEMGHLLASL